MRGLPGEKSGKMALTIWICKKVVARIEAQAEAKGVTRSKYLADLLGDALNTLEKKGEGVKK